MLEQSPTFQTVQYPETIVAVIVNLKCRWLVRLYSRPVSLGGGLQAYTLV